MRRAAHACRAAARARSRRPTAISGERSIRGWPLAGDEGLEPPPALGEGQRPQVLVAVEQDVVEADEGRDSRSSMRGVTALRLRRCCRSLKRRRPRPPRCRPAARRRATPSKADAVDDIGEGAGDLVAGARVEPHAARPVAAICTRMPSHFHSAGIGVELGLELREVLVLERMRQHQRPEDRHVVGRSGAGPCRRARRRASP